jgi:hypothetical protein
MLETAHDLTVKYSKCFVKYKDSIIRVEEFTQDGSESPIYIYYNTFKNKNLLSVPSILFNQEEYDFTLPKLGFINIKDSVVNVTRKHKRDSSSRFKRALHLDTIAYKDLSYVEKSYMSLSYSDPITKIVDDLFNPKFYTFEEAIESVLTLARLSTAITPSIAIKLNGITNTMDLVKNSWSIGSFNVDEGLFELNINIFNEELSDLGIPFRRKYDSAI